MRRLHGHTLYTLLELNLMVVRHVFSFLISWAGRLRVCFSEFQGALNKTIYNFLRGFNLYMLCMICKAKLDAIWILKFIVFYELFL